MSKASVRPGSLKGLIDEAIFKQRKEGDESVFHADLLALRIIARVEGYGHLINPHVSFQHLGGKLGLKIKTAGVQRDVFDYLPPEYFVPGFHITKDVVIENIGDEGEPLVGHHVPEKD